MNSVRKRIAQCVKLGKKKTKKNDNADWFYVSNVKVVIYFVLNTMVVTTCTFLLCTCCRFRGES